MQAATPADGSSMAGTTTHPRARYLQQGPAVHGLRGTGSSMAGPTTHPRARYLQEGPAVHGLRGIGSSMAGPPPHTPEPGTRTTSHALHRRTSLSPSPPPPRPQQVTQARRGLSPLSPRPQQVAHPLGAMGCQMETG